VKWETPPHALSAEEVVGRLEVELERGLDDDEVERRLDEHGANRLQAAERRSAWRILAEQFASVVLILLAVAAVIAMILAHWTEAIAILAVLLVNTIIGFVSEWRAVRTMEALQQLEQRNARVLRSGDRQTLPAEEVVPGDVVLLEPEDVVPADLRIVSIDGNLRVEEAALTGESVPVSKNGEPVSGDAPLAERTGVLYKGTSIAEGEAVGVAVATGMDTELGSISSLANRASSKATPLQRNLDRLGRRLAWVTIAVAVLVAGVGLLAGQPTVLMLETAIALGVAAIPEGLPIVATLALARGMWLMAQREAVVNRLTAVETLGATRIIFSDKTGTLTENRMQLVRVRTDDGEHRIEEGDMPDDHLVHRIVETGVLCSNADLENGGHGDPTEIALLEAGRDAGLERAALLDESPEIREESFDPDVMMMATFHRFESGIRVSVKGAPNAVIEAAVRVATASGDDREVDEEEQQRWRDRNREMARQGLRVMAMAEREVEDEGADPYSELRLLGLVGLLDPPREGVREAVAQCRDAGIRVAMVTGDQADTARAVADEIEIIDDSEGEAVLGPELEDLEDADRIAASPVFARVSPAQKLRLVEIFQDRGEIVAMTGDGVNDAPALKQADIGVAMGRRGTDAARQVADMVLRDDALMSIVAAVRQGRVIFSNIRKSVMFMLCTNVAEVLAVAIASAAGFPLPLKPLQILYLNVLTDVFPALALGLGRGSPAIMEQPPRPADEPVITQTMWATIGGWSSLLAGCVLAALLLGIEQLGLEQPAAVTLSFLTIAFAKLWFVFNLSDPGSPPLANDVVRNPLVWASIGLCALLLLAAVYLPPLADILGTRRPGVEGWATILALSAVPLLVGQTIRITQWIRSRR
jgi:Ca2+-transporting ATPase